MTTNQGDNSQRQESTRSVVLSYIAATLSIALCCIIRLLFQPVLGSKAAFTPFYIPVLIGAWIGGWRIGLFTIVLSTFVGDYFFVPPLHTIGFHLGDEALPLVLFAVIGLSLCGIGDAQRNRTLQLAASEARYRRLSAEVGARAEREGLVNRIGAAIRMHDDPERIQAAAVNELGAALKADRCYLAIYDLRSGVIVVNSDWHRDDLASVKGEYPFVNTAEMFKELYRNSNTSVIADCYESGLSQQTIANMERLQLRSRASVALTVSENVVATLTAATTNQPRDWTFGEVELLEAVATLLKSALESARAQMREHRIATELQNALQPQAPKSIAGLRIAHYMKAALDEFAIGGDFFDVFPLDKQVYALVIGDVSGKGLTAAAQVATVRNMLRAFLYDHRDPAEAASKLNSIVTANELLPGFVTIFAGIYDAGSGQLEYVSCGHEPALLRRSETGSVEAFKTTGPPIGVSEQARYERADTVLNYGDTLLLYTDGLSESGPNRQSLLGIDGLSDLMSSLPDGLTPDQSAGWIVNQAGASNAGVFRDDVCVIIARRAKP